LYTAVCVDLDDIEANCALEGFAGTLTIISSLL